MLEYICWGVVIVFVVGCAFVAWCCCAIAADGDDRAGTR